ncbi:unnamed protein product [Linum trigynum]|uniref:Uncharacterized protein n=1 Tax=Linum trigynum TaxID=586398 RepID=A0AAV2D5C3_9ROSI
MVASSRSAAALIVVCLLLGMFAMQSAASYEECYALCLIDCAQSGAWLMMCYPKCAVKCIGKAASTIASSGDSKLQQRQQYPTNGLPRKINIDDEKED